MNLSANEAEHFGANKGVAMGFLISRRDSSSLGQHFPRLAPLATPLHEAHTKSACAVLKSLRMRSVLLCLVLGTMVTLSSGQNSFSAQCGLSGGSCQFAVHVPYTEVSSPKTDGLQGIVDATNAQLQTANATFNSVNSVVNDEIASVNSSLTSAQAMAYQAAASMSLLATESNTTLALANQLSQNASALLAQVHCVLSPQDPACATTAAPPSTAAPSTGARSTAAPSTAAPLPSTAAPGGSTGGVATSGASGAPATSGAPPAVPTTSGPAASSAAPPSTVPPVPPTTSA